MVMAVGLIPVGAGGVPPTTISRPELAAVDYMGVVVYCTLSAPDSLRRLIDQPEEERGYHMTIMAQDFKTDGGSWHYTPDGQQRHLFEICVVFRNALTGGDNQRYLGGERLTSGDVPGGNKFLSRRFNSWTGTNHS